MKRMQLLSAIFILSATVIFTSCKSSRVWETRDKVKKEKPVRHNPTQPPPRYYSAISLIISPTPGFVMNRYSDGRYYHRSPQGLLYWKGYDNRFFLDKASIHKANYNQYEYEQWKRYYRGS